MTGVVPEVAPGGNRSDADSRGRAGHPPRSLLRVLHRAEAVDAQVGGIAAVGAGRALLLRLRAHAAGRGVRADQRAHGAVGLAVAAAALIAGRARVAVGLARVERPE